MTDTSEKPVFYTVQQTAELAGVSESTILRATRGDAPRIRVIPGSKFQKLLHPADVEAYLASGPYDEEAEGDAEPTR